MKLYCEPCDLTFDPFEVWHAVCPLCPECASPLADLDEAREQNRLALELKAGRALPLFPALTGALTGQPVYQEMVAVDGYGGGYDEGSRDDYAEAEPTAPSAPTAPAESPMRVGALFRRQAG